MILRGPSRPELLRHELLADLFEASAASQPEQTALVCGAAWRLRVGSIEATACAAGAVAGACTDDAGSTPRMPLPVPKLAGCGGISGLEVSTARAIIALEVSGISPREGIVLVIGGAACAGPVTS